MDFSLLFFANTQPGTAIEQIELVQRAAVFADQANLAGVWLPERHYHAFGAIHPNPAITAAALSKLTDRVRLRAGSVVAPLHDATTIVEEWSLVDNLCNGRVELSLASGWNEVDYWSVPERYGVRRSLLEDRVSEIRHLWGGGHIEIETPSGAHHAISTFPPPVQRSVPLWLTAAANTSTFVTAGTLGTGVLTHLLGQSVVQLRENIERYRGAVESSGVGGQPAKVALMLHTHLGPESGSSSLSARRALSEYLESSIDLSIKGKAHSGVAEAQRKELASAKASQVLAQRSLVGTVESVTPFVEALEAIGVDEIACLIDFGLGADDVICALPALADLNARFSASADQSDSAS